MSRMSSLATIRELTTWANMRLTSHSLPCDNILTGLMEGETMKCLAEMMTGTVPKRLGSLEGLSLSQKITRVDWFIDCLKREGKLSSTLRVDSRYFAQHSSDHIFPVLWELIVQDVHLLWQVGPAFQKHAKKPLTLISEPLKVGPCRIAKTTSFTPFYKNSNGKPLSIFSPARIGGLSLKDPEEMIISLANTQLKMVPEGKRLFINDLSDLSNSKILCALVNSLVPGTFTSEVLLNDRWTINICLSTAAAMFGIHTNVTSLEINGGDEMGGIAFLVYFIMSGYQYLQACSVVKRFNELQVKLKDIELSKEIKGERIKEDLNQRELTELETNGLKKVKEEYAWLSSTYDIEQCRQWICRAEDIQADARGKIVLQMKHRFDVVTVPENAGSMSINELCEENVINLALTNGNGFYSCNTKETLRSNRRLVIVERETEEVYDDFTGAKCPKGSVRAILGLHPTDNVELSSSSHPEYELFFESPTRNKELKAGCRFMYQVFPGTPKQSERLLREAARIGDLETVEKLTLFYQSEKGFVNVPEPESGNTPLHFAARHGHFEIALHLLENGSLVNVKNNGGCSPFFVAAEGLHGNVSKLLIEWGGKINIKNNISKTALEVIRNPELKTALERKNNSYLFLRERLHKHDVSYLEKVIENHLSGKDKMASLNSRCVDGYTLLHWAAILQSPSLVQKLLSLHVNPNLKDSRGQTALHIARKPTVSKILIQGGGDPNKTDCCGNTVLHAICQDTRQADQQVPELVTLLIASDADLTISNDEGLLSIHYALKLGKVNVLEAMANSKSKETVMKLLKQEASSAVAIKKSFLYMSLTSDLIDCAQWLMRKGVSFKENEPEKIAFMLLTDSSKRSDIIAKMSFLFANGLSPNAICKEQSLLHYAAGLNEHPELTDLLVGSNGDVNFLDNYQRTPLFMACMCDNFHAARILLENGAAYSSIDVNGKTAFDYIKDHDEWMHCGYFPPDTIARLKAYSLKHSRLLVRTITMKMKGVPVEQHNFTLL